MAGVPADDFNREMLRAFVAERDEPCPNCGYNLRELTSEICPECGLALRLRVGLVEPRQAGWVTGLVGLASGMGFFGIVLLVGFYQLALNGFLAWDFFAWFGSLAVVHVLALSAWILGRPWVRTRTQSRRIWLAIGCWMLPAVSMLLLVLFAPV